MPTKVMRRLLDVVGHDMSYIECAFQGDQGNWILLVLRSGRCRPEIVVWLSGGTPASSVRLQVDLKTSRDG